jgi:Flp pilus assembly protein TadG
MKITRSMRKSSGQSLVETVLLLPMLLAIVLNAINFGYFFLMALNLTASSRSSGLYSIMGDATPAALPVPNAGPQTATNSVSYLAYQDLTGAVYSPSTINTGVRVCSPSVGILNAGTANQQSQCSSFGAVSSSVAAGPDPELNSSNTVPAFLLNRVDIAYQFTPPIPLMPFNIILLASPACTTTGGSVTCTFYRHSEMRVMR